MHKLHIDINIWCFRSNRIQWLRYFIQTYVECLWTDCCGSAVWWEHCL